MRAAHQDPGVGRTPLVPVQLTRGPFHVRTARRYGLTTQHLRSAAWQRLGGGLYAWREIAATPIVRLTAASQRLPGTAVFSGLTAAWLHGLDVAPCDPIEVTMPMTSGISHLAGVSVRRSNLPSNERSIRKGLPATSVVRTLCDLGRGTDLVGAVATIDMALHRRLARVEELSAWSAAHRGYPGIARLRLAIDLAEPASESVMETRLRLLLVLNGLPRPQAQVELHDDAGLFIGRPDLYYPSKRLALEYDGVTHRDSLAQDNRRQNRMLEAGHRLLRFTAGDILDTPASVVAIVRRGLA